MGKQLPQSRKIQCTTMMFIESYKPSAAKDLHPPLLSSRAECVIIIQHGGGCCYILCPHHLPESKPPQLKLRAEVKELTKPAISSAPMFGGQQNSSFPTASSSASSAPQSASSFSFKPDSQAPSAGPISNFPTASGFANKPAISFSNAVTGSAASFTFAGTTASDGASSGFNNTKAVSASTFSFATTTTSGAGASAFSGFGAAATAVPASTPSPVTGAFGGTTIGFWFWAKYHIRLWGDYIGFWFWVEYIVHGLEEGEEQYKAQGRS
ncbi:uncharacterized protein LOC143925658 [Lithobates pipiens]